MTAEHGTAPAVSDEARRLIDAHRSACARLCEAPSSVIKANAADRALAAYVAGLEAEVERQAEALHRIAQWADAYPTDVFPVPDKAYYTKAHEVLKAHGMTLDRLSADAMRRVVEGCGGIAKAALAAQEKPHAPDIASAAASLAAHARYADGPTRTVQFADLVALLPWLEALAAGREDVGRVERWTKMVAGCGGSTAPNGEVFVDVQKVVHAAIALADAERAAELDYARVASSKVE